MRTANSVVDIRPALLRPRGRSGRWIPVAAMTVVLTWAHAGALVSAHDLGTTATEITLGDHLFEIRMECDLDALALGVGAGADDAELAAELAAMSGEQLAAAVSDLRQLFARRVRLFADDVPLAFEVDFPDRDDGVTLAMVPPTFLGLTARLRGSLPATPDATLRLRLSRAFPGAQLTVVRADGERLLEELVPRGEDSSPFALGSPVGSAADAADGGGSASGLGLLGGAIGSGVAIFFLLHRRRRSANGAR
jgi:hypothetical protein